LIQLRRDNPALYGKGFRVLLADQNDLVVAYLRQSDDGNHRALVVASLFDMRLDDYRLEIPDLMPGTWRDLLSNFSLTATGGCVTLSFEPSQVFVLCHESDSLQK
jgi:1,4-alpha-glucan branching enzyme